MKQAEPIVETAAAPPSPAFAHATYLRRRNPQLAKKHITLECQQRAAVAGAAGCALMVRARGTPSSPIGAEREAIGSSRSPHVSSMHPAVAEL